MNMNVTPSIRNEDRKPEWKLIDATNKVVGRLATEIADILRGKNKVYYTKHIDSGDHVVVINASKAIFTGDKFTDKEYVWHTGYIGGKKVATAKEMSKKHPTYILNHAVKGMLGSTKLAHAQIKKLHLYAGSEHKHHAQLSKIKQESGS